MQKSHPGITKSWSMRSPQSRSRYDIRFDGSRSQSSNMHSYKTDRKALIMFDSKYACGGTTLLVFQCVGTFRDSAFYPRHFSEPPKEVLLAATVATSSRKASCILAKKQDPCASALLRFKYVARPSQSSCWSHKIQNISRLRSRSQKPAGENPELISLSLVTIHQQ